MTLHKGGPGAARTGAKEEGWSAGGHGSGLDELPDAGSAHHRDSHRSHLPRHKPSHRRHHAGGRSNGDDSRGAPAVTPPNFHERTVGHRAGVKPPQAWCPARSYVTARSTSEAVVANTAPSGPSGRPAASRPRPARSSVPLVTMPMMRPSTGHSRPSQESAALSSTTDVGEHPRRPFLDGGLPALAELEGVGGDDVFALVPRLDGPRSGACELGVEIGEEPSPQQGVVGDIDAWHQVPDT